MRIISITNQKGGCGKTTTAVNLAASLSVNDRKVLLIDLDPQAHASAGLGVKNDLSIYNVLSKVTNKKARLQDIIKNLGPNFDIAPSSIILSTLEQELAGEIGRESRLWETLNSFSRNNGIPQNAGKGNYDYILIDCPPNLGILTINAIRASSEVIIPVEASRFSLEGLSQLMSIINLVRDRLSHNVSSRVLVSNFDSRLRHSFKMLERIKTNFKDRLFSNIIHVNVKLKEAQNEGMHILNFDKYCRGAKDFFSLAREIITQEKAPVQLAAAIRMTEKSEALVKPRLQQPPMAQMPLEAAATAKSEQPVSLEKKMREALKERLPKFTEIVFSVAAPQAKEVFIAGDFNHWKIDNNSRMDADGGTWRKKIVLAPGKYHYRFVIDGAWTEDAGNPKREVNPYGSVDSLVEVAAPSPEMSKA